MTPIERLNEILQTLKTLEDEAGPRATTYAIFTATASFMDDLPDLTQQLETAIIDVEDMKNNLETVWSEIGRQ